MENLESTMDEHEINLLVADITDSATMESLKAGIEALLSIAESAGGMDGFVIRSRFYSAVEERDTAYLRKTSGLKQNAVIIPPEFAPTAIIPAYVRMNGNHKQQAEVASADAVLL